MGQGFSGVPVGCYSEWRFKGALEITTTPTLAADQGNTPPPTLHTLRASQAREVPMMGCASGERSWVWGCLYLRDRKVLEYEFLLYRIGLVFQECPFEANISMERAGRFLVLPGLWDSVLGGEWKEGEQMVVYSHFFPHGSPTECHPWAWSEGLWLHLPMRLHTCSRLDNAKRLDHHSLRLNHESSLALCDY